MHSEDGFHESIINILKWQKSIINIFIAFCYKV